MIRRTCRLTVLLFTMFVVPAGAAAAAEVDDAVASDPSPEHAAGWWLVGGAAFVAMHVNCPPCEQEFPYRQAAGVLAGVGYRLNRRMNIGGEVFWVPAGRPSDRVWTTHLDAVAQFRPWRDRGLFVKGGAGMAFVRNWSDFSSTSAVTSKALSVIIGAGWEFRPAARVGYQLSAQQHATAVGDIQVAQKEVQNVLGNMWSIGAAIVIR